MTSILPSYYTLCKFQESKNPFGPPSEGGFIVTQKKTYPNELVESSDPKWELLTSVSEIQHCLGRKIRCYMLNIWTNPEFILDGKYSVDNHSSQEEKRYYRKLLETRRLLLSDDVEPSLLKKTPNFTEEGKRYIDLLHILQGRVNSLSELAELCSIPELKYIYDSITNDLEKIAEKSPGITSNCPECKDLELYCEINRD